MPTETDPVDVAIAARLQARGSARIRTGERRSDTVARKHLKAGADLADLSITTAKGDGYIEATVKETG